MATSLSSNFILQAGLPLDARVAKATISERNAIPNVQRFEGLPVYVVATSKTYQLQGGTTNSDWVDISAVGINGVQSIVAGANVNVDDTDPLHPIVDAIIPDLDFLPTTGTTDGPMTGDIEFLTSSTRKLYTNTGTARSIEFTNSNLLNLRLGTTNVELSATGFKYTIGANVFNFNSASGLNSTTDFSTLIGDLDYVQKIYVDEQIAAIGGGGGGGTITTVSVATANGFSGTVANPTTAPAISVRTTVTGLLKGNGTAVSAAVAGTDYLLPNGSAAALTGFPTFNQNTTGSAATLTTGRTIALTGDVVYTSPSFNGSGNVTAAATVARINGVSLAGLSTGILKNTTGTGVPSIAVAADFPTLNQNTTGNAATVTTNANLSGNVTSVGNVTTIANQAVTFAKMQNVATNKLLGRSTAGSGSIEEITIGANLTLASGVLSATGGGGGTGDPVTTVVVGNTNSYTYTLTAGTLLESIIVVPISTASPVISYVSGTTGDISNGDSITTEGAVFVMNYFSATTNRGISFTSIPQNSTLYFVIKQII